MNFHPRIPSLVRYGLVLTAALFLGACTSREKQAQALVASGQEKWAKNDPAGALADYNHAIDLKPDAFLAYFYRAELKMYKGDLPGSIADCGKAIQSNPGFVQAIIARGDVKNIKGDLPGALADYSAAIAVKTPAIIPELPPPSLPYAFFRRGVVKQIQGDFNGAIDDYARSDKPAPPTPGGDLPALYRHVLFSRLGREPGDIAQTATGWKDEWLKDIALFLDGKMNEADFLAAAEKGDPNALGDRECQSTYFAGEVHLINRDLVGAQRLFNSCVATEGTQADEREFARAELLRLSAPIN
jgi:tetratricopeptide (TPR) repeat protein